MSAKRIAAVLLVAVVGAWSCSRSPVSPTASQSATGPAATQAKPPKDPPPPPPPPKQYTMTLGPSIHDNPASVYPGSPSSSPDGSRDGLPSPGHLELAFAALTGLISGPTSHGNFTGSLSGAISGLRITNVEELPDWFDGGDPCQATEVAQLRALGLVDDTSSLNGSISMTWSEFKLSGGPSVRGTYPLIEWQLSGVTDNQGGTWTLAGHSGRSRPELFGPLFRSGSTADNLTVTVENSVIDFIGQSFSVMKCRVDYTATLVKTLP